MLDDAEARMARLAERVRPTLEELRDERAEIVRELWGIDGTVNPKRATERRRILLRQLMENADRIRETEARP